MSVCCVWERLGRVWGSEFVLFEREFGVGLGKEGVLCVGEIGARFGGVRLCCVWDRLGLVWGSEFVLCVGAFGVGLGE